ncbi:MAG: Uma2 family endonuclease [Caldilineaceae bacterium SB0675_bin_29]|uniref:Uma2 family endonuclease n=1 Tax=Caldilineaceae bacterium SB0675_bin_29 TaxID=2605266 RepID=A0A6B1FXF6_9CHLR|nr:Uma2 family endonuclease [Caldilineaceae bacterium SB0675_bin_29]
MKRANTFPNGSPITTKLTYEDYLKTSDDERYELLDGELITMPAPSIAHQHVAVKLATRLDTFVEDKDLGVVYFAPTDVVLSETHVVQPDLMFISSERAGIVTSANIQGAPDLLVEIRSDSTAERDENLKRKLYAKFGVKEYWLVNPDARTITVLLLGEDGYTERSTYTEGQTLTSSILDGFSAHLDEIFLSRP